MLRLATPGYRRFIQSNNLIVWSKASVTAVGMGSNLFSEEVIEAGEWVNISVLCRQGLAIIRNNR